MSVSLASVWITLENILLARTLEGSVSWGSASCRCAAGTWLLPASFGSPLERQESHLGPRQTDSEGCCLQTVDPSQSPTLPSVPSPAWSRCSSAFVWSCCRACPWNLLVTLFAITAGIFHKHPTWKPRSFHWFPCTAIENLCTSFFSNSIRSPRINHPRNSHCNASKANKLLILSSYQKSFPFHTSQNV